MVEDDVDISIAYLQERSAKGDSLTVRELKEDHFNNHSHIRKYRGG
jgi:hypothetical protein